MRMMRHVVSALAGIAAAAGLSSVSYAQTGQPVVGYTFVPKLNIPSSPAPGTAVISVGGLFQWMVDGTSSSGQKYNGQKLASDGTLGFLRIFLGMDGQATNGILYGTHFVVWQNFGNPSGGAAPSVNAGGDTLYVYQGYAYVGTATAGKIQVGAGNGPATDFNLGEFDAFNDGGWNGDLEAALPGGAIAQYPFLDDGNFQSTDKIVYFSPSLGGFDFGVSWEPSDVTLNDSTACATTPAGALSTCDSLSSSDILSDSGKRRNTFDVGARYRGSFGPLGVAISGGYIGSGVVNYTGGGERYHGLSDGYFGTQLTVDKVTFGGQIIYGDQNNGNFSLEPVGGKTSTAYIVGGQYESGPIVAGASYFNTHSTGDYSSPTTEGQRAEDGIAVGGYYALTPGLGFFVSYLYGQRKQSGYDFLAGNAGPLNNKVQAQAAGLGISLQW